MKLNNILIEEFKNGSRKILINRSESLNSLTLNMSMNLFNKLNEYNNDPETKFVLLSSNNNKSFSTGGDLKELFEKSNSSEGVAPILSSMYSLVDLIHNFKKPIISLINGFVIGSGVGISINCSHTIVSENVKWSMPENKVGYFPDVGTSYYLSKLGAIGLYLAMVGNFINSPDLLKLDLVQNHIPFNLFNQVSDELCLTPNISNKNDIDLILKKYKRNLKITKETSHIVKYNDIIQRCFNTKFNSVSEIFNKLNMELLENKNPIEKEWLVKTISTLMSSCPTSICVSFNSVHRSLNLDLKEILINDNRIGNRICTRKDLIQGINAVLIDKSFKPKFSPSSIYDIDQSYIDSLFLPFDNEKKELFNHQKLYKK
ncbi:hypothetical protein ACTFIW_007424 [Dictyostelium discoideum]